MTDFTLPHRQNRILALLAGVGRSFAQFRESVRAGLDARDAFERFSMLSDDQLARRGVARSEIPHIVMRRYLTGGN